MIEQEYEHLFEAIRRAPKAAKRIVEKTINLVDSLAVTAIDRGVKTGVDYTFDTVMDVLEKYGQGDPEVVKRIRPALLSVLVDVAAVMQLTSKCQLVGRTLIQGLSYFIALGDVRSLAVALGLAVCDILGIPSLLSSPVVGIFLRLILPKGKQQTSTLVVESEDDEVIGSAITAVWQSVSVIFGIMSEQPKNLTEMFTATFKSMSKAATTTRGLLMLFGAVTKLIYKMYIYCIDLVYGTTHSSHLLVYNPEITKKWASEVLTLIDPRNEYNILNSVKWNERLNMAVQVGKIIMAEISQVGLKQIPHNLTRLYDKLQDLYIKAVNIGYATAIRREPVCVWVAGRAGIGKTHMKDMMVREFLQANQISSVGNCVYTHTSGTKHWTGVKNKSVVLFDDFSTVEGEMLESDLSDFMRLVSDARFCPDQAAVEDKGTPVAPALVYVNCNETHPCYNAIRDKNAFLRRRHVVVEARRTRAFLEKRFITLESPGARAWVDSQKTDLNPYPHLEFCFLDPMESKAVSAVLDFPAFKTEFLRLTSEKYRLNEETYRFKCLACEQQFDEDLELPFEELLQKLHDERQKNLEHCPSLASSIYAKLSTLYGNIERFLGEALKQVRNMFSDLLPGFKMPSTFTPLQTEAPEEPVCICAPCDVYRIRKTRCITWSTSGKPVVFCGADCRMRCKVFWEAVDVLPLMARQKELVKELMSQLKLDFTEPDEVPEADEATILVEEVTEALQPRVVVPPTEVSTTSKVLLVLVLVLTSGAGLYSLYKYLSGDKSDIQGTPDINYSGHVSGVRTTELVSSGDNSTTRVPRQAGIAIKLPAKTELVSSGDNVTAKQQRTGGISIKVPIRAELLETEFMYSFEDILDKNTCYLILYGEDKISRNKVSGLPFRCLGVCGTYVLALKHYVAKVERTDNVVVHFVNNCATVNMMIPWEKVKINYFQNSELVVLQLPRTVASFKDIRTHFMTANESAYLTNKAQVYEKALGVNGRVHNIVVKAEVDLEYEDAGVKHVAPQALSYAWHNPGRCMSPIYATFQRPKIVGFHICGGNGIGAGEPVVLETLMGVVAVGSVLGTEMYLDYYVDPNPSKQPMVTLETNLYPMGIVKDEFAVRPADKTTIVPSLISGYVEPKTRPAPLCPDDVGKAFSPLVTGVEKHGCPPRGFPDDLLDKAVNHLRESYMVNCKPVRSHVGLLSEEEAVLGIPGLDGYQGMELSTSEGFPYVATRPPGHSNKRYQFDIEDLPDGSRKLKNICSHVREIMEFKNDLREQSIVPNTVFIDCLKDARISNEKYNTPGKTRIFSISPTDFTIQFRQYFGDILAAQKVNRFSLEHMVGMNIHSLEWTRLGRLVQSKGPKVLCGDYSNFGPSLDSEVVWHVGTVWCDWYEYYERLEGLEEQEVQRRRKVRSCMIEELRMSVHLCGNILYRAPCGSPSGAPCTVNLNNDVNKMYIYMAWLACWTGIPLMANFVAFKKHVVMFCYGDDIIINVSDEAIERFNNVFLHEFFAKAGIKYTDANKSGEIKPYGLLDEASFLKAKWIPHPTYTGIFLPSLDSVSVEDCANWVHKAPNMLEATRQAVCDSLMLAYGRGKNYFNSHRERLLEAWRTSQKIQSFDENSLVLYTWEDMDDMRIGVVSELIEADLDKAIQVEQTLRERLAEGRRSSLTIMQLITESSDDADFKKAIQRLKLKYSQLKALGIRVPAMERIIAQHS